MVIPLYQSDSVFEHHPGLRGHVVQAEGYKSPIGAGDSSGNVLIVGMVNYILGIGLESSIINPPATEVTVYSGSNLYLEADGNVQAIHFVLSSNEELDIRFVSFECATVGSSY